MIPNWNRFPVRSVVVFTVLATLLFIIEHVNGRFWLNDFRVYYGAANALLAGEPLYGVAHGLDSGVFKYAPVLALLFVPLALLPYAVAASIHYFLIVAAFIAALHMADRLVREHLLGGKPAGYAPLFLVGLVVIVHLHRELHLGNINVMLLFLLLLACERSVQGKNLQAGIMLGAAILAKPHFVVLLPLLLLHRKWRSLVGAAGTIFLGLLLPALVVGFSMNAELLMAWTDQMAAHNASLIYMGGDGYEAVNTVYSFLHRTFLHAFIGVPSRWEVLSILGLVTLSVGALVLRDRALRIPSAQAFTFESFVLLGMVPCITLTDTEHFLLALPMITFTVHQLVPRANPRWISILAVPALLAFGGNWEDALGDLSHTLVHYGVLGAGTLLLIVLNVILFIRNTRSNRMDGPLS